MPSLRESFLENRARLIAQGFDEEGSRVEEGRKQNFGARLPEWTPACRQKADRKQNERPASLELENNRCLEGLDFGKGLRLLDRCDQFRADLFGDWVAANGDGEVR